MSPEKELLAQRYIAAFERGDLLVMSEVLHVAETDAELDEALKGIDLTFADEMDAALPIAGATMPASAERPSH